VETGCLGNFPCYARAIIFACLFYAHDGLLHVVWASRVGDREGFEQEGVWVWRHVIGCCPLSLPSLTPDAASLFVWSYGLRGGHTTWQSVSAWRPHSLAHVCLLHGPLPVAYSASHFGMCGAPAPIRCGVVYVY
jgi:hypothetical protein